MSGNATIRRARFAPNGDPLAARLKLDRDLSAADWSVPGLPPAAILCARRLRTHAHRPGAIRAALDALARRAARPAREFVPAATDAVWFADTSEWLACLARDALAGELASRWWWDAVRRDATGVRVAAREWLAAPADAPAAWQVLAGWDRARAFAAALESAEAVALTREMCAAFSVRAHDRTTPSTSRTYEEEPTVREANALPPGPRRAALALGLLLARAPHRARTSAARVLAWAEFGTDRPERPDAADIRAPVEREVTASERPPPEPSTPRNTREVPPPLAHTTRQLGAEPDGRSAPGRAPATPDASGANEPASETGSRSADDGTPAGEAESVRLAHVPERDDAIPTGVATRAVPRDAIPLPVSRPEERPPVPARIDTAFGGLLYLVNVALALDLYPDFTEPARPGIALPLWDWLALLGRRWSDRPFLDDPLDGLLAALSGRGAGTPPGTGVGPPNEWRLPDSWRPWAEAPEPDAWPALADWFDWLAPVIARRLASALGTADPAEAPRWLIRRRAAILVAPAHLDVMLPLADLAVEIRAALLDRDPGWIPAAGTTVRFHYESHG